jgi:hypothetical protein
MFGIRTSGLRVGILDELNGTNIAGRALDNTCDPRVQQNMQIGASQVFRSKIRSSGAAPLAVLNGRLCPAYKVISHRN